MLAAIAACGPDSARAKDTVLRVGGVPDQQAARLVRRFDGVAQYLSRALGVKVEYVPSIDYAAVVTGFKHGDLDLVWFGGFTGVQARMATPGSQAIIQRPADEDFRSVFIVSTGIAADDLADLEGLTFSFGSENSTSGHVMPRHFLLEAGIDPDRDFSGLPGYSASHEKTWKLVESGTFQAGVLNKVVWDRAVEDRRVDLSKVRPLMITTPYNDYNWTIRPDVDERFGAGFAGRVREAFLVMGEADTELVSLFETDRFIETKNENYGALEDVARRLGLLR